MRKTYKISAVFTAILAASMTGCGNNASTENMIQTDYKAVSFEETAYTERATEQTTDTGKAEGITVSNDGTIEITEEGSYTLSGTAKNCTIYVNADKNADIQLILDGVKITNNDFPAIYVASADNVSITTTNSENTLAVSGNFTVDGDTNTDAVIYSKDNLVLDGNGILNITSDYGNGITSKDDMKITGGTYNVHSALDAFEANDSITINGGTFDITTNKDGFHCENDESEGTIIITDGTFSINSGNDGIQACGLLQIDGGSVDITSAEGLEATYLLINNGDINIYATDDGINATAGSDSYETAIEINGGNINVEVGQGDTDAIDSNGSIYVNGGTINVTAQMSSFDYDIKAEFNGGTIIVNGTEVSEIPQSMMGGGMHNSMNRGRNGFGRGNIDSDKIL